MHTNLPSAEELRRLLQAAEARGLSARARERLTWLLHYREQGLSVSETCRNFGITRITFYRLLHRFNPQDLKTLEDQSRRPHTIHNASSARTPSAHTCGWCEFRERFWPRIKRSLVVACVLTNLAILAMGIATALWETDLSVKADLRGDVFEHLTTPAPHVSLE